MSKFVTKTYGTPKSVELIPGSCQCLAVTVDDDGVVANADGKKIVPAGTLVGGGVFDDPAAQVKDANTEANAITPEGVLRNDVDVTYGPKAGAMIVFGIVNAAKLPAEPTAWAKGKLGSRIVFAK